jgi:hypothetical protein
VPRLRVEPRKPEAECKVDRIEVAQDLARRLASVKTVMKARFPSLRIRATADTPAQCSALADGRHGLLTSCYAARTQSVATLPFSPLPPRVQGVGRGFCRLATVCFRCWIENHWGQLRSSIGCVCASRGGQYSLLRLGAV